MNELRPDKKIALKAALQAGASARTAARMIGCSKITVSRYRALWDVQANCGCGQPSTHSGWCSWRLENSERRRVFLARWGKDGVRGGLAAKFSEAQDVAGSFGHQLGMFTYAEPSPGGCSLARARCKVCGLLIAIQGNEYNAPSFDGRVTRERCLTVRERRELDKQKKEKRAWRTGKRLLLDARRTLRGRSHSLNAASAPEPTSPDSCPR